MILKTIIFLFILENIQSASLVRTKLPRRFDDPIGIQVYNPKDESNQILQGKIVRIYDTLSEAQRDFRSLTKRGQKVHGQRFFDLGALAGILGFAQQAIPVAQQAIGLFQQLQGGGGGAPPQGPPPPGAVPPPGPPPSHGDPTLGAGGPPPEGLPLGGPPTGGQSPGGPPPGGPPSGAGRPLLGFPPPGAGYI